MNLSKAYLFLFAGLFSACSPSPTPNNGGETGGGVRKLTVVPFKTYYYTQTDFVHSDSTYLLEWSETILTAEIRPYSKNVATNKNGSKLTFRLPSAGNYVAFINGSRVCIFAERKMPQPTDIVRLADCDTTATINETAKIQSAIDAVAGTSQTLLISRGRYLVSQLRIMNRNSVKIHLERGAQLVADTTDLDSYDTTDIYGEPQASSVAGRAKWVAVRSFIVIDNSHNVTISGTGMINGQGRAARRYATTVDGAEGRGRYRNFVITRSTDVVLQDIVSADPGVWNTHIILCNNVVLENVKVINELYYAPSAGDVNNIDRNRVNTDGFDIDSSSGVTLKGCFTYASDDAACIKTSEYAGLLAPMSGVVVRDCVLMTHGSALKIGTETDADISDILFINNDVVEADRAITLYIEDGAAVASRWENNRVESYYTGSKQTAVHIDIHPRVAGSRMGSARAVINNTYCAIPPLKSEIRYNNVGAANAGTDSDLQVEFNNFVISGNRITTVTNNYFRYTGSPSVVFN